MSKAIYPGSFDPVTNGHLNIIERAAKTFDELIVCVMINAEKHPVFSSEERVELIRRVTRHIPHGFVPDAIIDDVTARMTGKNKGGL